MEPESQNFLIKQQKHFQLVQSNSQFFTVIRKSLTQNSGKDVQSLSEYLKNLTDVKIDYQNFAQCFIQIAYLIYTTKYYGLNPQIDPQSIRIQQNYNWMNQKRFSIIIYYRLNQQASFHTYSSIIKQIYNYLINSYEQYEQKVKQTLTPLDTEYKTAIKSFIQQLNIVESKINQFETDQVKKQNYFFIFLQETDLFRDYSALLKIKNSSMLDYIKIKFGKFKNFKQIDINLTNQYINEKKKNKSDPQQLKKKQQEIQKNITNFFEQIVQTNPPKFKLKLQPNQFFKTKFIFIIQQITPQPFLTRIAKLLQIVDVIIPQSSQIGNNLQQRIPYMEYQIQYNSQRNSICVRLIISSIACSNQSTDYIMFQSNVLTFQSANISLEFIQDRINSKGNAQPKGNEKGSIDDRSKQNNQQKKRNLAFRGASCFNNKEPILQKILTLMDLTMIAAKICQPELLSMRKNFMVDKDPQKLSIVYDKLNHYAKIFLKCAKKIYNQ